MPSAAKLELYRILKIRNREPQLLSGKGSANLGLFRGFQPKEPEFRTSKDQNSRILRTRKRSNSTANANCESDELFSALELRCSRLVTRLEN